VHVLVELEALSLSSIAEFCSLQSIPYDNANDHYHHNNNKTSSQQRRQQQQQQQPPQHHLTTQH